MSARNLFLALALFSFTPAIADEHPASTASISVRVSEVETKAYLKQYEKLFTGLLDVKLERDRASSEQATEKEVEALNRRKAFLEDQLERLSVLLKSREAASIAKDHSHK